MINSRYPLLSAMIRSLANDEGPMTVRALKQQTDYVWPDNANELEAQAASLTDQERFDIALGNGDVIEEIIDRHDIGKLAEFFAEVFDGDLRRNFFNPIK